MFIVHVISPADPTQPAELERRIAALHASHAPAQPTQGELIGRAVEDTDLLGDIDRDPHILATIAGNAADAAAKQWEEDHGGPLQGVPLPLFVAEDEARAEARLDAIEAGDTDADDNVIPYPRYRSL